MYLRPLPMKSLRTWSMGQGLLWEIHHRKLRTAWVEFCLMDMSGCVIEAGDIWYCIFVYILTVHTCICICIYIYISTHFCILHIETCILHTIYINLIAYIRRVDCWQVVSGLPLARSETATCSPIMAPVWKADYKSPWRIAPMAIMVLKHFQIQTLSLGQQLFCILDSRVEVGLTFCGSETAWVKHTVLRCTMLPHFDRCFLA